MGQDVYIHIFCARNSVEDNSHHTVDSRDEYTCVNYYWAFEVAKFPGKIYIFVLINEGFE